MLNVSNIGISFIIWLLLLMNMLNAFAGEHHAKRIGNTSSDPTSKFITPSGNISCALIGEDEPDLRCEIRSMLKPLPPQPYIGYCEFDWGAGLLLRQQGKSKILCISDTIASNDNHVLAYGEIWRHSGFKCLSRKTGLTCQNAQKRGFFLNRNKWYTF
jgi:hypothetical protein